MKKSILENFFICTGFAVFFLLIAVQAAMMHPDIKSAFFYEQIEGSPLSAEVCFFNSCKIELMLTNLSKCPDMKVLVNGEQKDSFECRTVSLDLKDGDVVQLDGCNVPVLAQVQISAVSRKNENLLGKKVVVSKGIVTVAIVN
jgi:hypothetical protein